jgi:SAM-dependent methyltransferase
MWNSVADAWEHHAAFLDEHLGAATALLLDAAGVQPGSSVLDVACGAGSAGIAAAVRVGEGGRVVLSDVAPAMVAAAGRRGTGLAQVSTLVCDQTAIDTPDKSFDAVICRHGLMFVVPPGDAVAEARRVLRDGGRYAAMTWDARAANAWLGLIFDAIGEQFGVEFPPPGGPSPFALCDPDLLSAALTAGGLQDVEVTRVATPMHGPSLQAWWELVRELAGPVAQALAGMPEDVREAIHQRALASAAAVARETADGIELSGSVLVASGHSG